VSADRGSDPVEKALESFSRVERGRVLARLIGVVGDFDLAEDALQDALVAATMAWPINGVPGNPAGWLVTTARHKAVDRLRSTAASERRQRAWGELAIAWGTGEDAEPIADDRLRLIFTCCHPALSLEAQVALTLRSLCGLSTEEVAKAFLISPTALAQRIVRAKRKIRQAGIAYRVPPPSELPQRLAAVLVVIYLAFNAGYLSPVGTELVNVDLCDEALRLIAVVIDLLPGEPEPLALAAMMYFQDSRRDARVDADGVPVTLEHQDRSRWDAAKVARGLSLLDRARRSGRSGPYVLKASIGAVHVSAPGSDRTDWVSIVRLYDSLLEWEPTAVVRLNRAVAVAMAESPAAGLALVEAPDLAVELADYHLYEATKADLLRRSGRSDEAVVAYRRAREQTGNEAERRFIDQRLSALATEEGRAAQDTGRVSTTCTGAAK
jgi:RNA polymerase sigma-70 factor (ECF subfamily)